jgi:hypothetical protein
VPLRLATATAIGDCRITSVTKEAMLSTIQSQPKLAKMFVDYLSDHNGWVKKELLGHLLKSSEADEFKSQNCAAVGSDRPGPHRSIWNAAAIAAGAARHDSLNLKSGHLFLANPMVGFA